MCLTWRVVSRNWFEPKRMERIILLGAVARPDGIW
jgi:hypothetical protein